MEFIEKQKNCDFRQNIVILGDFFVGKTILSQRVNLINKNISLLPLKYRTTISSDFIDCSIKMKNKLININVWDCATDDNYCCNLKYKSDIYFLLYDAFIRKSFEKAIKLYDELIYHYNNNIYPINKAKPIYVLIMSKYDFNLKSEDNFNNFVSDEEALKFTEKNNLLFFHISSFEKNEPGIKELFSMALKKYIEKNKINFS